MARLANYHEMRALTERMHDTLIGCDADPSSMRSVVEHCQDEVLGLDPTALQAAWVRASCGAVGSLIANLYETDMPQASRLEHQAHYQRQLTKLLAMNLF